MQSLALHWKVSLALSDLDRALGEIRDLRRHAAQTAEFRGLGSLTLLITALLAVVTACLQPSLVGSPATHLLRYCIVWSTTAAVSASLIFTQTILRTRRYHSTLAGEMLEQSIAQFLPAAAAGCLLTVVVLTTAPLEGWMLPGLWQLIYGLGMFASCRTLPRGITGVAAWFLLSGLACLSLGNARALSPWSMGFSYGVGQSLMAGVLLLRGRRDL